MNAFACDESPIIAAGYLADRHVVKMTLETAQILSTVAHLKGISFEGQYKVTHPKHPVVLAAAGDPAYLSWVIVHGWALGIEYRRRFGKMHRSASVIVRATNALDTRLTALPPEPSLIHAPYCGPVEHRTDSIVESYRRYLCAKYQQWGAAARWTNANPPTWLKE